MHRKLYLVLTVCLFTGYLFSASQYGFTANGWEPSAVNQALGGSSISAVNYWQANTLHAYANPAFPALYERIAWGYTDFVHMKIRSSNHTEKLHYRASLTGIGFRGLGILTSLPASYGTETDFGRIPVSDEEGYEISEIYPKDQARVYGLSMDLQKLQALSGADLNPLPYGIDLALGANVISNRRLDYPEGNNHGTSSTDLGLLARMPLNISPPWDQEMALGVSMFNAFDQLRSCTITNTDETIYKRLNLALGVSGRLKNPQYQQPGMMGYMEHQVSYKLLAGACDEFSSDPLIWGCGYEMGVADMFFARFGYQHDKAGEVIGYSYGLGARLHYLDIASVSYDYASFPAHKGFSDKTGMSVGADIDFMGLIDNLQSRQAARGF